MDYNQSERLIEALNYVGDKLNVQNVLLAQIRDALNGDVHDES